ncbi:H/ACA ribonucleoprotein complex subunit GAR1 [Haladaptatus caseinilyticus]|uniref:H/ACA ribonucleoprotein complex subunit GAR1 n=1 Tax=Haladaptatus caseinilyticus TaxID=2993314 RepID=UPI00224B8C4F|nr:Gar1/Naf1 family protein [Haladaptatus caseinilyticus]
MHRLGQVVRTAQNLAIVQSPSEEYPDIGTIVVDESLQNVGRVVDVFGPVSRPYVAVSPDDDTRLTMLVGSKLYAR